MVLNLATTHGRARALDWDAVLPVTATAIALIVFISQNGGFFPTTWNWAALIAAWVAVVSLALSERFVVSRLELITIGSLFALVVWVALSTLWTDSVPSTVSEIQRDLIYPVGALAAASLFRRAVAWPVLGSISIATTLISWYALATRIFPDHVNSFDPISEYRLLRPVGYWNALGALSAIGILLAIAFAAHGRHRATRVIAAASLVVLAPTLYFTYSRGAWAALTVGLIAAIGLEPKRLRLITTILVIAIPPVVAVIYASRLNGLTRKGSTLPAATHDGHRLALVLVVLAVAAAGLKWLQDKVNGAIVVSKNLRRAYVGMLVLAVAASLGLVMLHYGSPETIARRTWAGFTGPPVTPTNLNERLLSLSSNGRTTMWHHAWRDYRAHPVLGSGAGTYEIWYLRHRTGDLKIRDAHNLYVETLAELGPVGLALLLTALLTPLVAALRARKHPLVAVGTGAYVVFVVHAGVDWDWEMSALTMTGVGCGLGLLMAARGQPSMLAIRRPRYAIAAVAVAIAVFSLVGLMGNVPASKAQNAIGDRNWHRANSEARKEIRWAPWSADGWRRLGQSEIGTNNLTPGIRDLRKAIQQDPRNWDRWFDLALATEGVTQRRALERALTLNPRSPEIAEFVAGVGLKGIPIPKGAR